jgi:hypothetical protein
MRTREEQELACSIDSLLGVCMVRAMLHRTLEKLVSLFRRDPSTFLILLFQAILVICVGVLIQGSISLAQDLAVFAFLVLALGILIRSILFVRSAKCA